MIALTSPLLVDSPEPKLDPGPILQTAFAFWESKVLLTAVQLGVFTSLADRKLTGEQLGAELGLHARAIRDFFDALMAMGFLDRDGDGLSGRYFNTAASALYLDSDSPRYVGGWLVMLNDRLFKFWHDLPHASRTGRPQNETKHGRRPPVSRQRPNVSSAGPRSETSVKGVYVPASNR